MMEKILLAGFGPFGPHDRNVSGEAALRLDGTTHDGFAVRGIVLPVQLERAQALLEEALETERPAAVICAGIHGDPQGPIRVELAAKNERHYEIPDADGQLVQGAPVEEGGPPMLFSSLPVGAIKAALLDAGLATELSEDAGRYLCNAVFYWVAGRADPAGFIHLPPAPSGLDAALRALEIALRVTVGRLSSQRVEATAS